MKAIFDRIFPPKKFPLSEFLLAIRESVICSRSTLVHVEKIGGIGEAVWKYEVQLDEAIKLKLEFQVLEELSSNPNATIDELLCILDSVQFGISDSSFMFVQSTDKNLELAVASKFCEVRDMPDALL